MMISRGKRFGVNQEYRFRGELGSALGNNITHRLGVLYVYRLKYRLSYRLFYRLVSCFWNKHCARNYWIEYK